jgi:hypothetical protein
LRSMPSEVSRTRSQVPQNGAVTLGTTPDVDEPDAVDAAPVRPLRAVS